MIDVHYKKAINYDRHKEFLNDLYGRKWERLVDLNMAIIDYLIRVFNIRTRVLMSSEVKCLKNEDSAPMNNDIRLSPALDAGTDANHEKNVRRTRRIISVCKELGADTYISGIGGKEYHIEDMFRENGIALEYQAFHHPIYRQCYPNFIPNMAALDFIMNESTEEDGSRLQRDELNLRSMARV